MREFIRKRTEIWFPRSGRPNWFAVLLLPVFWPIWLTMLGVIYVPRTTFACVLVITIGTVVLLFRGMIDETVIGTLKSTSIATYIGLTILSYLSRIQFCFSSRKIPKQDL